MILAMLQLAAAAVGFEADASRAVEAHRAAGDLPGVTAAIAIDGQIVFAGAAGMADRQSGRTITADTPMYAGSVSKVFTAVLVLQAVEADNVSLDSSMDLGGPVDQATVFDLLTHSSGLPREGNFNYWFTGAFPDQPKLDSYLEKQSLRFTPGAELAYSNIGYAALGRLLERQSGHSYASLLEEGIVRPLALMSTGAAAPPSDLSRGYTPRDRIIPNASRPFAGVGEAVGDRHLREYHDAASITPAFGIYSNARDLASFGAALVAEESSLLSAVSRRRMLSQQRFGRGLGLRIENLAGRQVAQHSGWFAAHRSQLLLDDEANISIAVLTNSDDGNPRVLTESLYELTLELIKNQI